MRFAWMSDSDPHRDTLPVRVAVLSDIHANLPALDAVLAALGAVDAVWHLGDIVGYGRSRTGWSSAWPARRGRCARQPRRGGARRRRDRLVQPGARAAMEWTRGGSRRRPGRGSAALPERARGRLQPRPRQPARPDLGVHRRRCRSPGRTSRVLTTPIGLHGHTHLPMVWAATTGGRAVRRRGSTFSLDGRRALLNPGSVGQPRDGDPRPRASSILDTTPATATWHRVAYDIAAVRARCAPPGCRRRLVERLRTGL